MSGIEGYALAAELDAERIRQERPHPPRRSVPPSVTPLDRLMIQLDEGKWCYKLTSVHEQGERRYVARVWKLDGLGGSKKLSGRTALEALSAATDQAQSARRQRRRNAR